MNNSAQRIGLLMAQARASVGISQDQIAERMNVSRNTVNRWESGKTMPHLDQIFDYYDCAGVSIVPSLLMYLYPDLYDGDLDQDESDRELLHRWVDNASPKEIEALAYLISCKWGGSFVALLQMMLAHAHCNMISRVSHAAIIRHSFDLECDTGKVKDGILPDLEVLNTAYSHAKNSIVKRTESYVGGMMVARGEEQ